MEEKRKQQLMQITKKAYTELIDKIDPNPTADKVSQTVKYICETIAFGTIIVSGCQNPASYIGTYTQCKKLKAKFGGQIGAISNVWYWMGYASSDAITKIVANPKKNLILSVTANDIEETTLNLGEIVSMDIVYGYDPTEHFSYIGSYKTCLLLRQALGGKICKYKNHWHWIGYAKLQQIANVCNSYHSQSKRYKRKKIVFMS